MFQSDFDLVVSAFSLFDLKSLQERCETILNLWEKTGQFLVRSGLSDVA